MFDSSSSYYNLETAAHHTTDQEGRAVRCLYKRRRFLPPLSGQTTLVEHQVRQGERLDNITARYLSDPLQAFRVYDANPILHPQELLENTRRRLRVSMPGL